MTIDEFLEHQFKELEKFSREFKQNVNNNVDGYTDIENMSLADWFEQYEMFLEG